MIQALVGQLAQSASMATVARSTCQVQPDGPPGEFPIPVRRLREEVAGHAAAGVDGNPAFTAGQAAFDAKMDMSPEALNLETAMCVQDAMQTAVTLGRFGVAFVQTIFACPLDGLTVWTQNQCVITVGLVLNQLTQAASQMAGAVSHCGRALGIRRGATCLAGVMGVISPLAGLPAVAAGINLNCPGARSNLHKTFGPLTNPLVQVSSLGRRLANGTAPDPERLAAGARPAAAGDALPQGSPAQDPVAHGAAPPLHV